MKRSSKNTIKRSCKVFLNDLNEGKAKSLKEFLHLCHDVLQYFVDVFWARGEMKAGFADLETVHFAVNRFAITTRLAQALAKQAMEIVATQRKKPAKERKKPTLKCHVVTLFYHFLKLEGFRGEEFDFAAIFVGSGAPRLTAPFRSTAPINKFLADGWTISNTFRLGMRRGRLWIEIIFEKQRPEPSQHCPACGKWDRRNRRGDEFCCVFCGHSDHADFKAAKTLELLGLAGVYGLRSLSSLTFDSVQN